MTPQVAGQSKANFHANPPEREKIISPDCRARLPLDVGASRGNVGEIDRGSICTQADISTRFVAGSELLVNPGSFARTAWPCHQVDRMPIHELLICMKT